MSARAECVQSIYANGAVATTSLASWNHNTMPKHCSRTFSEPRLLQIKTQCDMTEFESIARIFAGTV